MLTYADLDVIGPNMNHQASIAAHRESKLVRLHGRVRGEELDKLMCRSILTYAHACSRMLTYADVC